jgi:hypothetical protein
VKDLARKDGAKLKGNAAKKHHSFCAETLRKIDSMLSLRRPLSPKKQ